MLQPFLFVGEINLSLYPMLIGLAALALTFAAWIPSRDWRVPMNAAVIAAGALAAGRAGFVALNWPYFSEHQNEIASFAGISEHAAIAGATIGYWLLAKAHQPLSTLHLSLVTALLLVGIAASIGCIPKGCGFGKEVFWQTDGAGSLAWLLRADWPDATLTRNPRWPAQALLAGWLTLGLVVLMRLSWKLGQNKSMLIMPVALLWFAAGDFMVQFTRGDAASMLANLRVYQWFDVMLAVVSILVLTRQILRKP
jgi:prolipoprotein diacylglyceryltransferase